MRRALNSFRQSSARPPRTGGVVVRLAQPTAGLLLCLLFGAAAALPLFANGGFLMTRGGGDSPFLLLRLHQLLAALQAGEFPARWMPDAAYGYGFPFFSYYAALPYYLAALLRLYGFSFVLALKLTQLGALLAAAAGMYAWARSLPAGGLTRPRAVLATATFTFAPFHLVNLYVRGDSLSELWAMAFYPWLLWSLQRCLDRPSLARALAVALLVGGLTLTHNISALNFMPFAGLYGLLAGWTAWRRCRTLPAASPLACARPVAVAGLALAWGLGLAAFFWLPALRESAAVQIGDVIQGYFFYGNHFRGADLLQTTLFYNAETSPGQPTPFAMGLVQTVLAAVGLVAWLWAALRARRWTTLDTFLLIGVLLSTWMITPASAWAWERLPLVRFTQFPWRFLSIQALFLAPLTAHLVPNLARPRLPWAVALGASLLLALFSLGGLRPDFVPLRDADVTAARLQSFEYFSLNLGSTIGYEYLPSAVTPRPYTSDDLLGREPSLKVLRGAATGTRLSKQGSHEAWTITVQQPATVALPTYFWPGWSARLDGQPAPLRAAPGLGWITLDVPAGTHTLTLSLGRTPLRAASELMSALLVLLPLGYLVNRKRGGNHNPGHTRPRRIKTPPSRSTPVGLLARAFGSMPPEAQRSGGRGQETIVPGAQRSGRGPGGEEGRGQETRPANEILPQRAILALVVLGAILLRVLPSPAVAGPLSMDFIQLTYPHHDPVRFQNGAALLSLAYSDDTPARGDTLKVTTRWRASAPSDVLVEFRAASNPLNAVPVVLAQSSQPLAPGSDVPLEHSLPLPVDIPPGVYFVTVSVGANGSPSPALTSSGRERGLVHLAPLVVDDERVAVANEALGSFGPSIDLLSAELDAAGTNSAQLNLVWHARQPLAANYVLAVRLRDLGGLEWSGLDAQTAYGFYPTALWRPGEVVSDFYGLPLPTGLPPGDYALSLDLHDPATGLSLGHLGLTRSLSITTPAGDRLPRYALLPALALSDVEFPARIQQGDAPEFRLGWLTLAAPAADYRARWTLTPAGPSAAQAPIVQVLDLAPGSRPSRWPSGAYVLGRVRFGTPPALAPGLYALSVQLEDEAGQLVGEAVTLGPVEITGRPRSFDLPPIQVSVDATFGDQLKLWGYDEARDAGTLTLTLVWGALDAPGRDYKFFVHLFNQADGFVAAQVDAIPRDFTYGTVLWLPGEVVTDTITLPLAALPAGQYGVAVGWYDPAAEGLPRLPALDAQGQPLPDDRVVLPIEVIVP